MRGVKRADDRRVLNGIFWRLRAGALWADIPARYGPCATCANRFDRWRRSGHWGRIRQVEPEAYRGDLQMIDSSSIRVQQHGANGPKKGGDPSSGKTVSRTVLYSFRPWAARAADHIVKGCLAPRIKPRFREACQNLYP